MASTASCTLLLIISALFHEASAFSTGARAQPPPTLRAKVVMPHEFIDGIEPMTSMCSVFGIGCPPPSMLCDTFHLPVHCSVAPPPLITELVHRATAPVESLSAFYSSSLHSAYYRTTATQALLLVGAGDAISQKIEAGEYDPQRTMRMALLGMFIGGFGTACWLSHLEQWLPGHATMSRVVEKAALDACVWAPIANTLYLVLTPLLEGKNTSDVRTMLTERFLPVMATELSTFFPYNLVSFSMIHPLYRPFTTGFVSMCFAVYISWVTHAASPTEQAEEGEHTIEVREARTAVVPVMKG